MKKTIIVPIVAVVAILTKLLFNVNIDEDLQAQIVDVSTSVSLVIVAVYGIFKNHKK